MVDDSYEGYHLPKGALIIANSWCVLPYACYTNSGLSNNYFRAILHDERIFEDPSVYNPERFLNEDGQLKRNAKVTNSAVFGYGRRVCAGRYYAELSLWINIATLLWAFEIVETMDKDETFVIGPLSLEDRTTNLFR